MIEFEMHGVLPPQEVLDRAERLSNDYHTIVRHPIALKTVRNYLEQGTITEPEGTLPTQPRRDLRDRDGGLLVGPMGGGAWPGHALRLPEGRPLGRRPVAHDLRG